MFSRSVLASLARPAATQTLRQTTRAASTLRQLLPPSPSPLSRTRPRLARLNPSIPSPIRRHLSTETRSIISAAISSKPVVLFMKGTPDAPQCGFSRASIQILALQGVDPEKFAAYNVLDDEDLRQGVKEFSDWPTIPQLYVDGEFVGGCDILVNMHQQGELAKLLGEKGVLILEEDGGGEKKEA